ncbi:MAG: DUF3854 domain-containing protein [Thermodesulfobacteriota bacterium]|jgi:hypothetical protein|nr:MAG: DUF3854 domain-containing protein [Thermodesulfobacteriota bacterium]
MSLKRSLHPEHVEDLRRSGLSDEAIKEADCESIPPDLINREIGNNPSIKSAYKIPYPGTDGFCRYKVFYHEGKGGPKYRQPKASGNRLYIVEETRAVLGDPSIPIYFTEGEKKTLKACQEGLYCVGLSGLWNWSNGNKELIPDFDLIAFKDREVFIVPDNDWQDLNKHGYPKNLERAVKEFAYKLMEKGARVFIIQLPKEDDHYEDRT